MTNPKGVRRGTRDMFARGFKKNGVEHLTTYLRCYKKKQFVDIKGNGAFQRGMPHKSYHGKTGKVYNVSNKALGLLVNKRVRGRIIEKRINVRIEHVTPSRCNEGHKKRVQFNEATKKMCREKGIRYPCLKRQPEKPRSARTVDLKSSPPEFLTPIRYEFVV